MNRSGGLFSRQPYEFHKVQMRTVTWRQTVAAILATILTLGALVVVVRSDGTTSIDAAAARATRWFVHQSTGRIVLADGYGGRALASLEAGVPGSELRVAEGRAGAYVVDDTTGEVRSIDSAALRLGAPRGLATLGTGRPVTGVVAAGLVVADADAGSATLLPVEGEAIRFDFEADDDAAVAPDGAVWSLSDGRLVRSTTNGSVAEDLDAAVPTLVELTLVGNRPFVVDRDGRRARFGEGEWVALPTAAPATELIAQQAGPAHDCGWVAADDDLWCVGENGLVSSSTVAGLDVDGSDLLAIAGEAAVLVRRGPTSIVRLDLAAGRVLTEMAASVSPAATLEVTATVDLVWIDDVDGEFVWAVTPWGLSAVDKNDGRTLELGDDGELIDDGGGVGGADAGVDEGASTQPEVREPDDDGVDDPPVALDDPVSARTGRPVTVPVTANDYDPDGEAIVVVAVGRAGHGRTEIGTASSVVYTPEPGYVGLDEFTYTIADGDGTEATATVRIELIASDATNRAPIGAPDTGETGPGVPVVLDVLLNDIDPDRDLLRIGSFSFPEGFGDLTETVGPSGLAALRLEPLSGFEGTVVFTYRPVDSFGASGDDVEVRVEVARDSDPNRPPVTQPDAVRLRRGVTTPVPVLVNDVDPDGDTLSLSLLEPLPEGLRVDVQGEQLEVTALAGARALVPFRYQVDDGRGHVVEGAVLVSVIGDADPNRPPVVEADSGTAVVGRTVEIDVLANDTDPDGDPLVVVDVTQPDGLGEARIVGPGAVAFTPSSIDDDGDDDSIARFTYTVDDGNGHQVTGDIAISVLPEPRPEPPFARDDSTSTFVDTPVTIDVLRNDGDPSGTRPTLVGSPGCPSGGDAVVTADGQVRYLPPAGRSGAFRCTYEVANDRGLRASAAILVSVKEPLVTNQPPDAVVDRLVVETGSTTSIDVTLNDVDPDGEQADLTVVSSTAPTLGTATRTGNRITFTAGSIVGVTTISYQVADAEGAVSVGALSIQITEPRNDPPTANDDSRRIFGPGVPTTIDVLANDFDPNQPASELAVGGVTVLSGDGSVSQSGRLVTIVPNPSFVGDVVATYTVTDAGGLTATARLTLTVLEPLNRPPDAVDDAVEVANGASVTVPVLLNDSDPDGDPLSMSVTGRPDAALGSISAGPTSITFNATPGASGTAVVGYSVSDGEATDTATLRITVRPCAESQPVAPDAFLFTGYQQPIAVPLAAYAQNGTVVDVRGPAGFDGSVYTPPAGQNGNVTIDYSVVNTCRLRASGRITIDVNRDPVPQPATVTMQRADRREIPVSSLAGDDEALTITGSVGAPAWATVDGSSVVLSPSSDTPVGTTAFTVSVADPGGLSATVSVSVTVVNAAPIARADTVDVAAGATVVDLVANDTDVDGDPATLRLQSIPTAILFENGETGTVTVVGADERRVRIDAGAGLGRATFTYTVVDAEGTASAPATVTVVGAPFNRPPVVADQTFDVVAGTPTSLVVVATDPNGDSLSIVDLVDPGGIVTGVSGLTVTVLLADPGSTTFTLRVSDGSLRSGVVTITVRAIPPATTTTPPTTAPSTTAPPTTAPSTTAPSTTAPPTTAGG